MEQGGKVGVWGDGLTVKIMERVDIQCQLMFYCYKLYPMIKKIIQNPHVRCNFCLEWYIIKNDIKNCLYLCDSCLDKALTTTRFKVPSSSGEVLYQVYLISNHIPMEALTPDYQFQKNFVIQHLEEIRNRELQQLLAKWAVLQRKLDEFNALSVEEADKFKNLLDDLQTSSIKYSQSQLDKIQNFDRTPLAPKNLNSFGALKEEKRYDKNLPSPLKSLNPKRAISPINNITDSKKQEPLKNANSCIYFQRENEYRRPSWGKQNSKKNPMKKSNISQKSSKDLEAIKKDALKSKIYSYLQNESSVPSSLILVMTLQIYDAIKNTNTLNKCLELVLFNLSDVDIRCYLSMLEWKQVQVLKLVKVGLTDDQLLTLLDFLGDKSIESLVVTSNRLTETSCEYLIENPIDSLKNVYLGRNKILRFKIKEQMKELEDKYHVYL